MSVIPDSHADLLSAVAVAQVATVGPRGEPQVNPVWFTWDGTCVIFSLTRTRQKFLNLGLNHCAALCISDPDDPYRYLELRGPVEIEDDSSHDVLDALARRYLDVPTYPWNVPGDERVVARLSPEHATMGFLPAEYRRGIPAVSEPHRRQDGPKVPMDDAQTSIANLIYLYAESIDAGDFEGLADLLSHATLTAEGTTLHREGYEEVLAHYVEGTRRYEDGTPKTKHVTTNLIIDVGTGTAASRSYCTVFQAVPGALSVQPIWAGRYQDRFAHIDGTWRFTARHFITDLLGDLDHHLLFDLESL